MTTPLQDIRVVDLSSSFSGAFASRLFGDFGAEVILLESRLGHPLRTEPPFIENAPSVEGSFIHAYVNWNKRSVCIDDETDQHDRLIGLADVVVTTTTCTTRLEHIRELVSSDAIHLSVTPHGLSDPLTSVPGNNLTHSARSGWASINGYGGEPPLALPRNQSGVVGGVTGFIAAVAALRRRHDSSNPELVDVSELEALALTVHPWGVAAAYNQAEPRIGLKRTRPRGSPGPLWDLADGRMNFGLADFKNWTSAMQALNLPELGSRENLIPDIGRHSQDLREVVHGLAQSLPSLKRWDVFHKLTRLRCVVGVVQDTHDLIANEQVMHREFLAETKVDGRSVRTSGPPAKLSPSAWRLRTPAPRLGSTKPTDLDSLIDPHGRNRSTNLLSTRELQEGPLSRIRVLSFGQAWSGTFATELLALLGADVVQVASHYHPDAFRRIRNVVPPLVANPDRKQHPRNTQGHYNSVNLHKREITLDLRSNKGRDILWRLIPKFDILVDNFRPGVLPSWGVSLEKLNEVRPGMIWASISGYGETGPYRDYPANGATTEPMSGFSSIHGYVGDSGMNTGGLYPDPISGYFVVAFILAALNHRDRTGKPQRIDLSMMEAVTAVLGDYIMEYSASGMIPRPSGNEHLLYTPHDIFPTSDDYWVAIAVESDDMWKSLTNVIDCQGLKKREYLNLPGRQRHRDLIHKLISSWTEGQSASVAERELCSAGVCAARVVPLVELYSQPSPHFVESGFLAQIDHPEAGVSWLPGRPWRFSAAKQVPIRPAPCVGQHSWEVFATELGISEETYKTWVAEGLTGTMDDV